MSVKANRCPKCGQMPVYEETETEHNVGCCGKIAGADTKENAIRAYNLLTGG